MESYSRIAVFNPYHHMCPQFSTIDMTFDLSAFLRISYGKEFSVTFWNRCVCH